MEPLGLIAGNGQFPLLFARAARVHRRPLVAVAHRGETEPELAAWVDTIEWIEVGELGRMLEVFRTHAVRQAVMAGGIRKQALLEHFAPDARGLEFLAKLESFGDDAILRALARELEGEGIAVLPSTLFLEALLTPCGVLTARAPSEAEWADIRLGLRVAKALGEWDIGQTVVVRGGVVVAVEAIEGTDATIARSAGRGGVVVKVSKPQQDLRFDVPAVGPRTVESCRTAGVAVLALEAGKTLLLEREAFLASADAAGLAVVGVEP